MIRRWNGQIGGFGRRLVHTYEKRGGIDRLSTSEYMVHITVGITSGPEAEKGRRVDIDLTAAQARQIGKDLIRLAETVEKENDST